MKNIPISNKIPELDIAIKAAQEASNIILEIYQSDYDTFTKNDNSPVTDADLKSNEVINEILSNTKHSILSEEDVDQLFKLADVAKRSGSGQYELNVDLNECTLSDGQSFQRTFEVESFRKRCLLEGLDNISLALQHTDEISAWEKSRGLPPIASG